LPVRGTLDRHASGGCRFRRRVVTTRWWRGGQRCYCDSWGRRRGGGGGRGRGVEARARDGGVEALLLLLLVLHDQLPSKSFHVGPKSR
jgi:hypothetical protein